MSFHTLAIVGVGLIGGSLGMATRERKLARRVIGIGRNESLLARARDLGAVDETTTDLAAVAEADFVVLCTPVETIPPLLGQLLPALQPHTLVTDVGSTKAKLVSHIGRKLRSQRQTVEFIGSHPMAGSEKTGVEHSSADLFQGRSVIITPTSRSRATSVSRLTQFWEATGAQVHRLSPAAHDRLVAAASHVPHLVASALAAATPTAALPLVAGGWLDSTRIAAGDVQLWRQIFTQNRERVLMSLARFEKVLQAFREALETDDQRRLVHLLQEGKRQRDAVGS